MKLMLGMISEYRDVYSLSASVVIIVIIAQN